MPLLVICPALDELREIPFSCPSDFDYRFNSRLTCKVRTANLICMWLMLIAMILATSFVICIPEGDYDKLTRRSKVTGTRGLGDDCSSTRLISKHYEDDDLITGDDDNNQGSDL
ncbi:9595_t:CDS:2 [Funneliformis mosseae]|uniref:9595_t:CDS:1 n=1 Tax=Funneliformis mosseae TaxID=27381 RepID=A0A9N8UZY0_FUNMO|nr:9595_t:CDS:2 [Funneliformis mosseae]